MNAPSALAREAELLRFRLAHHLGGSPERLRELLGRLERQVPHHPVVRTARALQVLPETGLPGPPPELADAAEAWLAGDPVAAHAHACRALAQRDHVRTRVTVADLAWVLQRPDEARDGWTRAAADAGSLAPLEVRLGRAALGAGQLADALDRAVRALIQNPLYGTAFVLLAHVHRARGHEVLTVPLPPQVRHSPDGLQLERGVDGRARAAWREAVRAAQEAPSAEAPPGAHATAALLTTWRALPAGDKRQTTAEWPLRALDRWERTGVLETYLWAIGLTRASAGAFRSRSGHQDRDRRFWAEGVLQQRPP